MNEKISSLFDSEINNKDVDTLLSKKSKMEGVRSSMSDYQLISDVLKKKTKSFLSKFCALHLFL